MHVYGGVADDPQRPPTDRSAAAGSRARRPQINRTDRRTSPLEPQINPNRPENPATNQSPRAGGRVRPCDAILQSKATTKQTR